MRRTLVPSMMVAIVLLGACTGGESDSEGAGGTSSGGDGAAEGVGVDTRRFGNSTYPLTVGAGAACTLSGGTATTCVTIRTKDLPEHTTGPFCQGGYWLGEQIYAEPNDCTLEGQVEGCLECAVEAKDMTFTIPTEPVPLSEPAEFVAAMARAVGVGIALNGVALFLPDPEQKLTSSNNQAPLDACGGHAGLANDYHYHRIPTCLVQDEPGEHSPMFAYALDGYAIYGKYGEGGKEPADLDACQGHSHGDYGYHYHAKDEFPYFVGCFMGELGESTGGGMGGPPGGMGGPPGGMGAGQ